MRWVIVAHSDDEVIFAGGAILSHRQEPWTVVIATQTEDSPRAAESLAARDQFRALGLEIDYRFLGHPEEAFTPYGGIDRERLAGQLAALGVQPGERVYTHGSPGEYGHNGHKAVHAGVVDALGDKARLTAFSGGGQVVERIVDAGLLAEKARLFNVAYPSQAGVWIGLARTMIETTLEERHYALSVLDDAAAGATNPLRAYAPALAEMADRGTLVLDVNTEIRQLRHDRADVLIIGSAAEIDLDLVRSRYSGRVDFAGPFESGPPGADGAQVVADDFTRWHPTDPAYDLILCVGLLSRLPDFDAVFRLAGQLLRPQGQLILTYEPLIHGHHDYGRAYLIAERPYYRRPAQAVLDLSRRNGMKLRMIKDLVTGSRLGEPVVTQLVRAERR